MKLNSFQLNTHDIVYVFFCENSFFHLSYYQKLRVITVFLHSAGRHLFGLLYQSRPLLKDKRFQISANFLIAGTCFGDYKV